MTNLIHQVLVIFSDGLDEDVMTLEKQVELLRQSGKNWEADFFLPLFDPASHPLLASHILPLTLLSFPEEEWHPNPTSNKIILSGLTHSLTNKSMSSIFLKVIKG